MKQAITLPGAAVLMALLSGAPAQAELVPVTWDASGRFVHEARVEPGKFVEVCDKLPKGAKVVWSYRSGSPMDFNIHYHVGKDVKFPAKRNASAAARGVLAVNAEQDYCWMWSNKRDAATTLSFSLARG